MSQETIANEQNDVITSQDDYKYGFREKDVSIVDTGKGLNEDVVREISKLKNEPEWMTEFRLNALKTFESMPMPSWGPDLSEIDFQDFTYFKRVSQEAEKSWDEVPKEVKNTFERLGIPEAERKYLAGVTTQYESEAVYHNMLDEVRQKGVVFLDIDSALKEYPDLFRKYFATIVPPSGHDWLNGTGNGNSCWSCVRRKYGKHPFTSCGICACGCDNVFFYPFS